LPPDLEESVSKIRMPLWIFFVDPRMTHPEVFGRESSYVY
jgi:hypothetical protein